MHLANLVISVSVIIYVERGVETYEKGSLMIYLQFDFISMVAMINGEMAVIIAEIKTR